MLERLRFVPMATTATILTRALRTDITGLAGLSAESSLAPARGITGAAAAGAMVTMDAAGATDAAVMVTVAPATVTDAVATATRATVMRDMLRQPASTVARTPIAAGAGSMAAERFMVEAEAASKVVAADMAAADTARLIADLRQRPASNSCRPSLFACRLEIRNQKSEVRNQKSEAEVRSP